MVNPSNCRFPPSSVRVQMFWGSVYEEPKFWKLWECKVCGCLLVCFSCSPTSTDYIHTIYINIDIYNVALAILWWNICKYRIENWTSLALVMIIGSACLLLCELHTEVLPIVFGIECRVVINIWRRSLISFKHVSLRCLLCDPHRTTYRSNVGVRLRKATT